MSEWIAENPWRAVLIGGAVLGALLSIVSAAVNAGWPGSPWARALAAAVAALPANVPGMLAAARAKGEDSPK